MNDMWTVIFIILIILISVLVLLSALLMLKTGVEYQLDVKNFKLSFDYSLIICGKKVKIKKKKSKDKPDTDKKDKKSDEKPDKKIKISDILEIKTSVFEIADALIEISKKTVVFEKFGIKFVCALDNPAANGILYGGLHSVLNVIYAYFTANCNVKKSDLKIDYDFKSSEGLLVENNGKVYVRPLVVIFKTVAILMRDKELYKHIKNVKNFFNK